MRCRSVRHALAGFTMLMCAVTSVTAQVSIGVAVPGVSIGINLPRYPELVQVPRYPVYYAPRLNLNLFFYDGLYWVLRDDDWYASSWYNGPWRQVNRDAVPLYVLRVPVRYYRQPPAYFSGWRQDAPPRWGDHWGGDWEQRRSGWDQWNRRSAPPPAPPPVYQRRYSGDRYPQAEQQQALRNRNYRYEPRDDVVRQHVQERPSQPPAQRPRQDTVQRERHAPGAQGRQPPSQGEPASPESGRGQGQRHEGDRDGRGQDRNR